MNANMLPDGVKVLSVSELTQEVKGLLEDGFPSVWVTGEVSNLARPSSGHLYLTLKDGQAQLRAVMWRGMALRLRFDLRDGQEVIVRGRLSVYPPRGEYQLVIEELQPKGIGAQELALRQLKEKLFRLGYFAPERKKPLPRFPQRVALVTSPSGAAVRDMLETLSRRWPAVEVWVCPVPVQGEGAAEKIAEMIRLLNRLRQPEESRIEDRGLRIEDRQENQDLFAFRSSILDPQSSIRDSSVDVIIIGRGGGSMEDLGEFNKECIAQAIYESAVPVVSAVGHETDWTIADGVADFRALTPTHAATQVVADRLEMLQGLRDTETRLRDVLLQRLDLARRRLDDLAQRRAFRLPLERIRDLERRLDEGAERLGRAVRQRLGVARERVQAQAARLESLSPLNVLGRGYSLTRMKVNQVIVRNQDQVRPGDLLETTVQHGRITSLVLESDQTPPTQAGIEASPLNHG
jgi:exodeoxyribonuclease VII large subunit